MCMTPNPSCGHHCLENTSMHFKRDLHYSPLVETCIFLLSRLTKVEPETDMLSATSMRSYLIFPRATVAHSGKYVCRVDENVKGLSASASINITVLGWSHTHTQRSKTNGCWADYCVPVTERDFLLSEPV